MHGEEGGENRKLSRHMWSVPSTTSTNVAGVNGSNCSSSSSFFKVFLASSRLYSLQNYFVLGLLKISVYCFKDIIYDSQ